ncbi:MAG: hypothetical protein ACOZNI_22760 [Myxococcota bacterium]
MPDLTRQTSTQRSTSTGGSSAGGAARDAQSTVGNSAIADQIKSTGKKPTYTGIVHFGLNGGAQQEASWLNKANGDKGGAKSIRNQKEQDVLERGGQRMDLSSEEGRAGWLATLGLGEETIAKVEAIIRDAGSGARDELGQLVEVYAQAESGVRRIDRLVLSGHNVGTAMWGDDNGRVPFETFVALKEAFPNAAAQVRHLLVSACYSGGEKKMDIYRDAFPGLMSIMAYTGSSPGTFSGAQSHLTRWEKATEEGDGSNVDKDIAKNTRKGENVSTWNATDGYQGDEPMQLYEIESDLSQGDATFDRYYTAGEKVTDPQTGELREYYNLVQRALRHPELADGRKAELEDRRDRTIRLLFWHLIRGRFAEQHKDSLKAGYDAIGQALPEYAKMERAEALAAIRLLESQSEAAAAYDLLHRGLEKLDSDLILENWI